MTLGVGQEIWLDSGYGTGTSINRNTARYGQWVGEGWWGGSEMGDKVGAMPPEDALDALGQLHDLMYSAAEDAGKLYGEAEKNRLLALADEIGYRAWQQLPQDPRDWRPPPRDPVKAADFSRRFAWVMRHMADKHESERKKSPPPTPEQLRRLNERGPWTARDLEADGRQRVDQWNVDRGRGMRSRSGPK